MLGTGRTLRVAIVGVKVQDPRRYHVSVQVLGHGALPSGVAAAHDSAAAARLDQVARTETSELSRNPEFIARSFVLRLNQPLCNSLANQALLQASLFAAPSLDSSGAASCTCVGGVGGSGLQLGMPNAWPAGVWGCCDGDTCCCACTSGTIFVTAWAS